MGVFIRHFSGTDFHPSTFLCPCKGFDNKPLIHLFLFGRFFWLSISFFSLITPQYLQFSILKSSFSFSNKLCTTLRWLNLRTSIQKVAKIVSTLKRTETFPVKGISPSLTSGLFFDIPSTPVYYVCYKKSLKQYLSLSFYLSPTSSYSPVPVQNEMQPNKTSSLKVWHRMES